MKEKFCTGCGRNCNLDNPKCGKGVELAEEDDTFNGHSGDWLRARKDRYKSFYINNKLFCNIRDMCHTVRAMSDGKASQSRILYHLNWTMLWKGKVDILKGRKQITWPNFQGWMNNDVSELFY